MTVVLDSDLNETMTFLDSLLLVLVGTCGISDICRGKIYNNVTYTAIALGFAWNAAFSGAGFASSMRGFLFAAVLMGGLAIVGGTGGGDAKLLSAIGAIKGYPFVASTCFFSFLTGAAIALIIGICQRQFGHLLFRSGKRLLTMVQGKGLGDEWEDPAGYRVPFGAAITIGTIWAYVMTLI